MPLDAEDKRSRDSQDKARDFIAALNDHAASKESL
jgi:hypothetical protein